MKRVFSVKNKCSKDTSYNTYIRAMIKLGLPLNVGFSERDREDLMELLEITQKEIVSKRKQQESEELNHLKKQNKDHKNTK